MKNRSLRNYLYLQAGLLASSSILLLLLASLIAFGFQAWWLGVPLVVLAVTVAVWQYRTIWQWVKFNQGMRAFNEGRLVQAEALFREALHSAERSAAHDPRRGIVLEGLACIAQFLGNYDDAESFGKQALTAHEQAWGDEHPVTLHALQQLAQIYIDIARYAEAEPLLEKAQRHHQTAPKPSLELASCLNLLGRLFSEQGRYARAEPLYRQAFDIVKEHQVESSGEGLSIALNLARLHAKQNRLAEAEMLVQASLEQAQMDNSAESYPVALCLDQLALIRHLQGREVEAEEIQRRALAMTEKIAGPNTPALSGGLSQLGEILKAQGKFADAEPCCLQALRLREEYLAPEHPALAEVLEHYADLLNRVGRLHEAETFAHRASQIRALYSPLRLL